MVTLNYNDIKRSLEIGHNLITPAELHGILCGLICTGLKQLDENQATEALMLGWASEADHSALTTTLMHLFNEARGKIKNFELNFQLLLPDDDEALSDRAREFGKWCEGFMAGMGLSGQPHRYRDPKEVAEILAHLSEIAKIEFSTLKNNETNEDLFAQVTEFVRLAVFAIYQELMDADFPDSHSGATTLH